MTASSRGIRWLRPLVDGSLAERDAELTELMDSPECDPAMLTATYAGFPSINAVFSGWRSTYVRFIRPQLSTTVPTRLLDIGSGGGDLAVLLAGWARRDGLRLRVTGIDPDERAHAFASAREPVPGVDFRQAFSSDLVENGESFDIVISNHMLHHLSGAELGALLSDTEVLAPVALHSDITRGRMAYAGFGMLTWPFFRGSFIRSDGLTSIRRSHTPVELRAAAPSGWSVLPQGPFRYLLTRTESLRDA